MSLTGEEIAALALSARVSTVATCAILPLGVALAWLLARAEFRGKVLLDALISAPLVLPPVVTGYLLLRLLGRNGPVGRLLEDALGIRLAFTWQGAAIAAAVVSFPLLVRASRVAIAAVDLRLEEAATTLGAGRMRVFFGVTLPLAWPGVIAGSVLAFARSLGEFGATITFAGNVVGETRTLPLAIYSYTQVPGGEAPAMRLAALTVLLSVAALVASDLLERRLAGGDQRHGRSP